MKREELRKVEFNEYVSAGIDEIGFQLHKVIKKKGYFHRWFDDLDYDGDIQISTLYAIVEDEKGNVSYKKTNEIRFID